ncbi:MAG: arylsulfatase [Bacteroidota bacterium]|nr:MAG: arylsulfatase [Bacteroidota bacterium]
MNKDLLKLLPIPGLLTLAGGCARNVENQTSVDSSQPDRTVLPIKEPARPTYTELDARNATAPERWEVKAPEDAPNVVVILIDDMGFGVADCFGGPVEMPNLKKLADNGLRYNRFHTTALSAPTRVALLTGYNHHSCNMGSITETATAFPGNNAVRPQTITPVAEVLRQNGFNTAQFGKCHEVPPWELSISGPQDRWPTRSGFEKFYGFLGGETNQWAPLVYDGVTQVEIPHDPNYHFTTDMTNQSISWMKAQNSLTPDKPFFIYYAPGATHAPHHAPKEWIEKNKGKYDMGWDKLREQTLARQIEMGIVPENAKLAPKPKDIKDWDSLSVDEKKLFTRQMEVFAAFAQHTDYEIGRLISAIEETGEIDNTVIVLIAGDNGSSAEGQMDGMYSEMTYFNQIKETVPDMLKHYDDWGSESTYPHFSAGWAVALDAPFSYTKQVASDFGGTRNGMVISWPKGIEAKGEIRAQFGHVIDITPTIYEITQVPAPKMVNGIAQDPIEGTSLAYSFDNPHAEEQHKVQYFEMFGNRAIYADGWFARTIHRAAWQFKPATTLQDNVWELYNTAEDFSLANNLAAQNPEKLKELQDLFMKEAEKYHVLPIDDRTLERTNAALVGRPTVMEGRTSMTLAEGMKGLGVDIFIDLRNTSYSITSEVDVHAKGNGVIVCQGGRFGGLSLYLKNGKPMFAYNYLGLESYFVSSNKTLEAGKHTLVYDFKYDGDGFGKGGVGTLLVDGVKVAEAKIPKTQPGIFSVDDLADVGMDEGTQVADYGASHKFNGKIENLVIEVKK